MQLLLRQRCCASFHSILFCATQSSKCGKIKSGLGGLLRGYDHLSSKYDDDLTMVRRESMA
jgi:hypothetical protein